ncbi:MAG: transporter [Alteromonadaceae bacterium]|uniref:formate/nitrite transporter family protein n=1 Tax=unclassified Marinobacter TaxID=83889 RepID=UPI000C4616A3|nr:formate/nitrite transporter family protein [Marinobacter sp. BGYM27]MAA66699.1 transporter [Alteromonadaceae bacterium]MBH84863.1 transporter [Alteromonadaceae bacterium]MDG5501080.1 formate/nitrite transporter family protein [Marinobacter sp. BGYM27]|tara:strand:- start:47342 stop:48190 length:849 start_codon:yes stop_codon:yes gene_type:complete
MTEKTPRENDLNSNEKRDARQREAPSAAVVYEAIRREAESELSRPLVGLGWSALAAGLSMGFSLVAQALLYSYTPEATWRPIISSFGYSIGFLFVILGRQQLFTENTLTPVLEVLRVRKWVTVAGTLKLWLVVLLCNMIGTAIFAIALSYFDVLDPKINDALSAIAAREYEFPFGTMFVRAIFAGWLVALMLWLMPFAETARVGVIILVTYVIGLAHFPHIVAGSVAALYGVFQGDFSMTEFFTLFFTPTLLGNMVGGIMLVAAVNYAQVAYSGSDKATGKA